MGLVVWSWHVLCMYLCPYLLVNQHIGYIESTEHTKLPLGVTVNVLVCLDVGPVMDVEPVHSISLQIDAWVMTPHLKACMLGRPPSVIGT